VSFENENNKIISTNKQTNKQASKQREKWKKNTGRLFGSICQHFSINCFNNTGQFEGISGVNPLSLYSIKQSNNHVNKKEK
jgi:hypothetical protein